MPPSQIHKVNKKFVQTERFHFNQKSQSFERNQSNVEFIMQNLITIIANIESQFSTIHERKESILLQKFVVQVFKLKVFQKTHCNYFQD